MFRFMLTACFSFFCASVLNAKEPAAPLKQERLFLVYGDYMGGDSGGMFHQIMAKAQPDRPFACLDAGHARMHPQLLNREDLKPVAQWKPPTGGGYDVAITHPYVDGRWFVRGHSRIYCFDLRKPR